MSLYTDFMGSVTVTYDESEMLCRPRLIRLDENRCYFEGSPNVVFNTSLTKPGRENAEKCVKDAAYYTYIALLKAECEKRGIDENLIF